MKKLINYFKSLRISTIYKIVGVILFIGIVIWLIITSNKLNDLSQTKVDTNTNASSTLNKTENTSKKIESNNNTIKEETNVTETIEESEIGSKTSENTSIPESKNSQAVSADIEVLSYVTEVQNELENSSLREKAKEKFILIVDFLFYDGKIKGYTFDELSTKTKLKVLQIALAIDSKIDTYFPGYKETISATTSHIYTNIKELVVGKYLEITTKICTSDPETCESAKQDFQDMKKSFSITWDMIKTLASTGVSNLKAWYEIYSGK